MNRSALILAALVALGSPAFADATTPLTQPVIDSTVLTHATKVSAKAGPLIAEAQSMAKAKDYRAALAKLNEAEAVKSLPEDATVIKELRRRFEIAMSGDPPMTRRITPQFPEP